MESSTGLISRLDRRIDSLEAKLKSKEMSVPMDLVGGIIMLVAAVVLYLLLPSEIKIKESDVVNGRVFPSMLMILMGFCSLLLIVKEIVKLSRGQQVNQVKLNLLVEVKAVVIFCLFLVFYFVSQWCENFAVGACAFTVLMLLFFRCKKWHYYLITLAAAVLIWVAFRYGLNVRF